MSYTHTPSSSQAREAMVASPVVRSLWCALVIGLAGCFGSDNPPQQEAVLIRVDQQTITQSQFDRAFEAARIAYSDDRAISPQVIQDARLRLLNQMAEELIIDHRARELNIVLDEAELEAAIEDIKTDYPADEFEQMLLENAIPYSLWKDRLRVRLLMEKVVDRELVQSLEITPQEIETYYRTHADAFAVAEGTPPRMELRKYIVDNLKREKVEEAYPQWLEGLRQRYGVKINWELWKQSQNHSTGSTALESTPRAKGPSS